MNFSKTFFIFFCCLGFTLLGFAGDSIPSSGNSLHAGVQFNKSVGFYWMNGFGAEFSSNKILNNKISLGVSFISSKLGSALASKAIQVYEITFSPIKYFRPDRKLKPLVKINVGYAHANYGSEIFNEISNQSMLLSLEAGAAYDFRFPLRIVLSGGYNLITGNGTKGLGTIFPLYGHFSVFYKII